MKLLLTASGLTTAPVRQQPFLHFEKGQRQGPAYTKPLMESGHEDRKLGQGQHRTFLVSRAACFLHATENTRDEAPIGANAFYVASAAVAG